MIFFWDRIPSWVMLVIGATPIEILSVLGHFLTHFSSIEPNLKSRLMLWSMKFEVSYKQQHLLETSFISNRTFKSNFIFFVRFAFRNVNEFDWPFECKLIFFYIKINHQWSIAFLVTSHIQHDRCVEFWVFDLEMLVLKCFNCHRKTIVKSSMFEMNDRTTKWTLIYESWNHIFMGFKSTE